MPSRRSTKSGAIVFAVALTFVFGMTLTLFLGVSQFTDAVRAAFDVRLAIAADDAAGALEDASRVGVTIRRSPAAIALLRRELHSDPMIATVGLRDPNRATMFGLGDTKRASDDSRLSVERQVVSDYGVTLATVRATASRSAFARRISEATYALLLPAIASAVLGIVVTSAALLATIAFFARREHARRAALAEPLERLLAEAHAALEAAEAALQLTCGPDDPHGTRGRTSACLK